MTARARLVFGIVQTLVAAGVACAAWSFGAATLGPYLPDATRDFLFEFGVVLDLVLVFAALTILQVISDIVARFTPKPTAPKPKAAP